MDEKYLNQIREKHILKTLQFLQDGGDFEKASLLLEKGRDDQNPYAELAGHPLRTLNAENTAISDLIDNHLLPDLKKWQQDGKNNEWLDNLRDDLKKLKTIKYHYKRKENSLYVFLVKYGLISEDTSSELWGVNDKIRDAIKDAYESVNIDPISDMYVVEAKVEKAAHQVKQMIFVEETALFPILTILLTSEDWHMVKQDELEMGYTLIKTPAMWRPSKEDDDKSNLLHDHSQLSEDFVETFHNFLHYYLAVAKTTKDDNLRVLKGDPNYPVGDTKSCPSLVFPDQGDINVKMEIGSLSLKEIPAIFNVLPIDLTFVDSHDRVKWFSNSDRVFPRTRSVIGRPVIRCHPPKSINKVLEILDEFHKGEADDRDFWVNVHGRTIYLRFYAVRDNDDNYLGCLETVQDVTAYQNLNGEKTLENQDKFEK
ncbi:hypothetical protein GCM10022297_15920 [Lactobacillus hamsteri]|uniref:Hemerythrin HHE cation binding domain-containing protein n=1 Tax=Lactobacillus hamsteri DSM 5661 = JCM 6256 TaxID=1423754 RepID=A0A0R1YA11_9LACO|nr:PAS domain-containing protein [Lactobacillus hamsteri]KRM39210.1 Hemerythrin HHE cation binding domain-containing protein [Lactobacillus hamsteri DSM 5661 = JCM 6256]